MRQGRDAHKKRWSDQADRDPVPHPLFAPLLRSQTSIILIGSETCRSAKGTVWDSKGMRRAD